MKVTLKDIDGKKFDIGLDTIYNPDEEKDVLLFWIDTPEETVTLKVSDKIVKQIISSIQFLQSNTKEI